MMINLDEGVLAPVPRGGAADWHAKREDHDADGEQMQILYVAVTELLVAP